MTAGLVVGILIAALLLAAFGGLMAASDAAITSSSRGELLEIAEDARAARSLRAIADDRGAHVNAINFVRIVVESATAVLVTAVFVRTVDELWLALVLSALVMSCVSFVLVGSSPRSVGRAHSEVLLRLFAPLMHAVRLSLGPIANLLVALGDVVTPGRVRSSGFESEEKLLAMVDEATERDVLEEDDREFIHSFFEFGSTVVREVMLPRTDMVTVEFDTSLSELMDLFLLSGVSRIPVVGEEVDDVRGIAYLRDVARSAHLHPDDQGRLTAGDLAKRPAFVPESMKTDALLRQMQSTSNHLALVVDEYGGIAGLVTLEDLIEELVGEINDEHDRNIPEYEELGDDSFRVNARLGVGDLGDLFGIELEDEDVDSVGGLLGKALERLPERGDVAVIDGIRLEAERVDTRRRRLLTVLATADDELLSAREAFARDRDRERDRDRDRDRDESVRDHERVDT